MKSDPGVGNDTADTQTSRTNLQQQTWFERLPHIRRVRAKFRSDVKTDMSSNNNHRIAQLAALTDSRNLSKSARPLAEPISNWKLRSSPGCRNCSVPRSRSVALPSGRQFAGSSPTT